MKLKFLLGAIAAFFFSMVLGAVTYYYVQPTIAQKIEQKENEDKKQQELTENAKQYYFTGWKDKPRKRALAVIIDNAVEARPQAGLENADVVVEFPVEGGLTRFIAVISQDDLDIVGPVRSARSYFVEIAEEYKAILVHAGGSEDSLELIATKKQDHLDEINGGVQVAGAFWRAPDRLKPHNLYTSSDTLRRVVKNLQLEAKNISPQRKLLAEGEEIKGEAVQNIYLVYPEKSSLVRFTFDPEKGVFARYITNEGIPHVNAVGEQLFAANVLVQYTDYHIQDGDGRLQILLHGEGDALIFRAGTVVKGRWQKAPGGLTKFTDETGKELPLLEGPTWIEVVPKGMRVDY
jgi:hypothetical protein